LAGDYGSDAQKDASRIKFSGASRERRPRSSAIGGGQIGLQDRPSRPLLLERPGVGGAGRGQVKKGGRGRALQDAPPGPRRRSAVEGDRLQRRKTRRQSDQIGGFGVADGGVQTAATLSRGDHVPQPDALRQKRLEPRG